MHLCLVDLVTYAMIHKCVYNNTRGRKKETIEKGTFLLPARDFAFFTT